MESVDQKSLDQKIESRGRIKKTGRKLNTGKLDKLAMPDQMWILREYERLLSYKALEGSVKDRLGIKISDSALCNWVNKRKEQLGNIVLDSPEYRERLAEEYSTIILDFRRLNVKTWTLIEELEKAGEVKHRLDAFKEIRAQIELANQILGFIEPKIDEIKEKGNLQGIGVAIAKKIDSQIKEGKIALEQESVKRRILFEDEKPKEEVEIRDVTP